MESAPITVVVATYNRPDVLAVALRSAIAEEPPVERILVIGDNCDDRTAQVCAEVGDHRLDYVNLPQRFGDQSGPNSVGMRLARSRYVALLNHDDVWLAGHVKSALSALEGGADFFIGRAANAGRVSTEVHRRPIFSKVHPVSRRPPDGFVSRWAIEPASAWVFHRKLVDSVGPWRAALSIYRTPISDWYLRSWRSGCSIVFGTDLTVLKVTRDSSRPAYNNASPEHLALEGWIADVGSDAVRRAVLENPARITIRELAREKADQRAGSGVLATVAWATRSALRRLRRLRRLTAYNRVTAFVYGATGVDLVVVIKRMLGLSPGAGWDRVSMRRTGHTMPVPPNLDATVKLLRGRS